LQLFSNINELIDTTKEYNVWKVISFFPNKVSLSIIHTLVVAIDEFVVSQFWLWYDVKIAQRKISIVKINQTNLFSIIRLWILEKIFLFVFSVASCSILWY
jgi:uncharacterized protein (DUF2225 family)